jgi:hypothetical protein
MRGGSGRANDEETRVRFRISREALDGHFSDGDRLRPKAAFKKRLRDIEGLARRNYFLGQREPNGSDPYPHHRMAPFLLSWMIRDRYGTFWTPYRLSWLTASAC